MSKQIIFLTLTFVSFSLFAQVPANGLMAWYKFNGNASDSSGNGNHGTVNGATLTSDRFGNANKAYYFNGVDNYIIVPASPSIQPKNSISIGVWVNTEPNGNKWTPILSKRNNYTSYPYDSYSFSRHPTNNSGKWSIGINGPNNIVGVYSTQLPIFNTWQFLMATYDGQNVKLYVDGYFMSSLAFTDSIIYSNLGFYVGNNSLGSQYFKGKIDDISIHNRALSACEIKKMYYSMSAPNPKANFTITSKDTQCLTNNVFNFKDSSVWQSSTLIHSWNFGESTTDSSSAINPNKTYLSQGIQSIKLIVTDTFGCVDSIIKQVTILESPKVSISVNNSNQCLSGNSFIFNNITNYNKSIANYLWNFSATANDTSSKSIPSRTYSNIGLNSVKLKIVLTNGCSDSSDKIINVYNTPDPSFTLSDSLICISNDSIIINTTLSGGIFTGAKITKGIFYPTDTGVFKITYTVGNGNCVDSTYKLIRVIAMPDASFTVSDSIVCIGDKPVVFNTKDPNGSFGGEPLSGKTFTPNMSGTFWFTYTVNNSKCTSTNTKKIIVYNKPNANFIYTPATNYINEPISFIPDTIEIKSFLWDFGDATTSDAMKPTHSFASENIFKVWLKQTNNYGCVDSTYRDVKIISKTMFQLPNAFSPNGDNINDRFLVKSNNIDKFHISIYNRWGSILYESDNLVEGWDGTFLQQPCPVGIYFYVLNFNDDSKFDKKYHGTITLIR